MDKNVQLSFHNTHDIYNSILMTFCLSNQPNQSLFLYEATAYKLQWRWGQPALAECLYQCTILRGYTFQNINFHCPCSENVNSRNTHKGSLVLTYAFIVSSVIGAMKTLVLSVNLTLSVPMCRITPVKTVCARPSNLLTSGLHSHTELCE